MQAKNRGDGLGTDVLAMARYILGGVNWSAFAEASESRNGKRGMAFSP
jgi:hypothetical protein